MRPGDGGKGERAAAPRLQQRAARLHDGGGERERPQVPPAAVAQLAVPAVDVRDLLGGGQGVLERTVAKGGRKDGREGCWEGRVLVCTDLLGGERDGGVGEVGRAEALEQAHELQGTMGRVKGRWEG